MICLRLFCALFALLRIAIPAIEISEWGDIFLKRIEGAHLMTTENTVSFQKFSFGTQVRKSPFSDAALRWGARGFSVYNHMYIPRDFGDPVQNFWNLVNEAILCDVAVERQVEITGKDAARFTQYLSCRDLSSCAVGQCKYVLLTDQDGGVINDPILLKLAEDHFWLSIADSDVLLWAKGVAAASDMQVTVREPDVSPLQLQGPRSRDILRAAFGDAPADLKYYRFMEVDWNGVPLIISRTGWSSELGYEIFLRDGAYGDDLWEYLMQVGRADGPCIPAIPPASGVLKLRCCPITRI
jgi:aminomethyltransferase